MHFIDACNNYYAVAHNNCTLLMIWFSITKLLFQMSTLLPIYDEEDDDDLRCKF